MFDQILVFPSLPLASIPFPSIAGCLRSLWLLPGTSAMTEERKGGEGCYSITAALLGLLCPTRRACYPQLTTASAHSDWQPGNALLPSASSVYFSCEAEGQLCMWNTSPPAFRSAALRPIPFQRQPHTVIFQPSPKTVTPATKHCHTTKILLDGLFWTGISGTKQRQVDKTLTSKLTALLRTRRQQNLVLLCHRFGELFFVCVKKCYTHCL